MWVQSIISVVYYSIIKADNDVCGWVYHYMQAC